MWKRVIQRRNLPFIPRRQLSSETPQQAFPPNEWSHPPSTASISDEEIYRLAAKPRQPLTLADLVKYVVFSIIVEQQSSDVNDSRQTWQTTAS